MIICYLPDCAWNSRATSCLIKRSKGKIECPKALSPQHCSRLFEFTICYSGNSLYILRVLRWGALPLYSSMGHLHPPCSIAFRLQKSLLELTNSPTFGRCCASGFDHLIVSSNLKYILFYNPSPLVLDVAILRHNPQAAILKRLETSEAGTLWGSWNVAGYGTLGDCSTSVIQILQYVYS